MPLDPADFDARLAAFDGRAITALGEIEAAFSTEPGYFEALVARAGSAEGHVSAGATWLIKSAFEAHREISLDEISAYCRVIPLISDWAAQLHACQTVQYLPIGTESAAALVEWLRPLLGHERPFVRAWALDALSHIGVQQPAFEALARDALAVAESDKAASVRARARHVRKRFG